MASTTNSKKSGQSHHPSALVQKVTKAKEDLLSQYGSLKQLLSGDAAARNDQDNNNDQGQQLQQIAKIVTQCQETLDELFRIPMTRALLEATMIGKTMAKLSKKLPPLNNVSPNHHHHHDIFIKGYQQLKSDVHTLLLRWKAIVGCEGLAGQVLLEFRKLEKEYARAGRAKPDMIAYKELRQKPLYTRLASRRHGELEGVPIGLRLSGRGEAAILGIHRSILSGIDAEKEQPCFAVCMAGKYDDDDNDVNHREDGIIVYTGMGGLNKKGDRQVEDQMDTVANASLILSNRTGDPIRLLRKVGAKGGREYQYDGLYQCFDYKYEASLDGPKVYKFLLRPMPNQSVFQIRKKSRDLRAAGK